MQFIRKTNDTKAVLIQISEYEGNEIDFLVALVESLRPSKAQKELVNVKLDEFIECLNSNPNLLLHLKRYLNTIFSDKKIAATLTDSDLISGVDFWSELIGRLFQKLLPIQPDKNTVEYVLTNVFYKESDAAWVNALDNKKIEKIIDLLDYPGMYELSPDDNLLEEILYSMDILSHRIAGSAFDAKVLKLVPEYASLNSPFAALQMETGTLLIDIQEGRMSRSKEEQQFKHVKILFNQCLEFVFKAYGNIPKYGISFNAHQQLMLIERLLERLDKVLDFVFIDENVNSRTKTAEFIKTIILFNTGKSKISGYLNKSTQNISKEVTRNIGEKGEHYITTTRKEYWKMLFTALGGGFIVALACIVKMNLGNLDISLFGKAFVYSMNYASAFIAIYVLHFTLATKQPAMTAATLAKAIENDIKENTNYESLSVLVARIWRSQFIAFVGNVFMAFPIALGLVMIWGEIYGTNPASSKSFKMIYELNIISSPAIFHAAIAGLFLFLSGLIAGVVSNRTKYNNVATRIKEHPILKQILSERKRTKIADYIDRNIGGIVSNFWFGVFMGTTGTVGVILGLDLDIRHITFAAGNFGLGLYGMNFQMSLEMILMSVLGVGIIGFVNFTVSFSLSLLLALRSRGIPFKSVREIMVAVKRHFFNHPLSFFFPPSNNFDELKEYESDQ
ncbi:MAG: recombinase [Saprospiraceae bacterium]|nr:recombinase [Saprospiraceae bacterium]